MLNDLLAPQEERCFKVLLGKVNEDVPIYVIYEAVFQNPVHVVQQGVLILGLTSRTMQQRLGTILSRVNKKLARGRVRPGDVKQTYRLDTQG